MLKSLVLRNAPPAPARVRAAAPLLKPVGLSLAALIVGVPAIFAWNVYTASEARRAIHESPVVEGRTTLATTIRRKVADDEVQFLVREADGALSRIIVPRAEGLRFAGETDAALERAREATIAAAARDLDALFADAFATRAEDLAAYADWFYQWGRSWRLLYEATTGAVQEAARLAFSRTQISDAARYAVEAYLLRHYEEAVLKPSLRDPIVAEGVRAILRDANDRYFAAVSSLDASLRVFLAEETLFRERIDAGTVSLTLDWDAETWRAPRARAVDRYLEPARTAALVGGGAFLAGPLIEKAVAPLLGRIATEVVAASRLTVGGAAVGSVQPGLGTLVGALAGLAVDWGLNAFQEYLERDDFIAANAAALDATIAAWKAAIMPSIADGIDVWFDDARTLVAGWGEASSENRQDRENGGRGRDRTCDHCDVDAVLYR